MPSAVVISVNRSPGGIPKQPLPHGARVLPGGLEGDGHDHEKHCTPFQAISILDGEDIDDLVREGYDLVPGSTGENLTVRALSVDTLAVGMMLSFSGGVMLELTRVRRPCYVLDAIHPELKKAIDGRCGFYARVIREGVIAPGEAITVMPVTAPAASSGDKSRT